jgi:crotonobetainyl-CoA:carnitine CoA-transferase CaiB-like acyl-CoA transferase
MHPRYHREKSGQGSAIAVSLFDSLAEQMAVPYLQQRYTGKPPTRVGLKHPSIAPYGSFETKDGRQLLISIQNEREWAKLCTEVLGEGDAEAGAVVATDPRFCTASNRLANRAALDALVAEAFAKHSAEELSATLLGAGVAFGALNSLADLVEHPQMRTLEYDTEFGSMVVPAPAAIDRRGVDPEGLQRVGAVPALGAHTDAILKELRR